MKNLMQKSLKNVQFLAPGVAAGKIFILKEINKVIQNETIENVNSEINRFYQLLEKVSNEFTLIHSEISKELDDINASIIETHREIILDADFQKQVTELISKELLSVELAAQTVLNNFADTLNVSNNEYIRQRANDIRDIVHYFNRNDNTDELSLINIIEEHIIVVSELFPSTILNCRKNKITGIITQHGSSVSHSIILAKSFGIPVAFANDQILPFLEKDVYVIFDDERNRIHINPDSKNRNAFKKQINNQKTTFEKDLDVTSTIVTKDGIKIDVYVNIDHIDEVQGIQDSITGIGLFRTEFLFMSMKDDFPAFEQQVVWYKKTVEQMAGKPVTFRVLDIGGDKHLPYFNMGRQENPSLGLRSHRVFQYHPEILETQIRAFYTAAKFGPVKIMYPMVTSLEDLEYFKNIIENIKRDFSVHPKIGIMVETPAAVFEIEHLVKHIDFVSIGTNDLVQYSLIVDRNNENVSKFYQPQSPVIIRMLKHVAGVCEHEGIPFSVCGEIASDSQWTPLLIGLGFRNLSINQFNLTKVKKIIANLSVKKCEQMANKVCNLKYLQDVKNLMAAS